MYLTAKGVELKLSATPNGWPANNGAAGAAITGTAKNDYIAGYARQSLSGGTGDDGYYLRDATASVVEKAGEGIDTAYIRYDGSATLAANVENMILQWGNSVGGYGNSLSNIIIAGTKGAVLNGMGGDDVLVGGAGADVFKVMAGHGSDAIMGFQTGWDAINLSGFGITSFSQLMALARQDGEDTRFTFSNGEQLVLRGTQASSLNAWDFGLPMDITVEKGDFLMTGKGACYNVNGWFVLNNAWGSGSLVQGVDYTISSSLSLKDMTQETTFNWKFPYVADQWPAIKAFPEVIFGVAPMGGGYNPTDKAKVFPLQVEDIVSVTADFSVSHKGTQSGYNVAYDIWLSSEAYGGDTTVTNEIMVWLHKGAFEAYGQLIGTYQDGDFTGKIYHTGTYTAIVSDKEWLEGTLDIGKIIVTLKDMGIVSEKEWLASVELGAEVVSGEGSLTIHDLELNVQSRNDDGSITIKDVTGAGTTVKTVYPNSAPVITSQGGAETAAVTVQEGGIAVTQIVATDKNSADTVTYSIAGGADAALFVIDAKSGALTFRFAPDYEAPGDANRDNVYEVQVQASDGQATDTQTLKVAVADVNEGPVAAASATLSVDQNGVSTAKAIGATDGDGDALSYAVKAGNGPKLGTVTFDQKAGSFVYAAGQVAGADSFVVQVSDGRGGTTEQTISVNVNALKLPPVSAPVVVPGEIRGTAQADTLTGTTGKDTIFGGAGFDKLYGGWGIDILHGEDGDDLLDGGGDANQLYGGAGNDRLLGGGSMDVLDGGTGADYMAGYEGNDTYYVDNAGDVVFEMANGARDTVIASVNYTLAANVEDLLLADGAGLTGTGNALANKMTGGTGNDRLYGGAGMDMLHGGEGDDLLDGGSENDGLNGGAGDDRLFGAAGNDTLNGDAGNDLLEGGDGSDTLNGGAGNDRLVGGAGNDAIVGGAGADRLVGGANTDFFRFYDFSESLTGAERDVIEDFSRKEGDRIDLRAMDANIHTDALDDFLFIGQQGFSGVAGELRYEVVSGNAHVLADVTGDGVADFEVMLQGVTSLQIWDFQL